MVLEECRQYTLCPITSVSYLKLLGVLVLLYFRLIFIFYNFFTYNLYVLYTDHYIISFERTINKSNLDDQNPALGHNISTVNLDEMESALKDENMAIRFRNFAETALVAENVDFLLSVIEFKKVSNYN